MANSIINAEGCSECNLVLSCFTNKPNLHGAAIRVEFFNTSVDNFFGLFRIIEKGNTHSDAIALSLPKDNRNEIVARVKRYIDLSFPDGLKYKYTFKDNEESVTDNWEEIPNGGDIKVNVPNQPGKYTLLITFKANKRIWITEVYYMCGHRKVCSCSASNSVTIKRTVYVTFGPKIDTYGYSAEGVNTYWLDAIAVGPTTPLLFLCNLTDRVHRRLVAAWNSSSNNKGYTLLSVNYIKAISDALVLSNNCSDLTSLHNSLSIILGIEKAGLVVGGKPIFSSNNKDVVEGGDHTWPYYVLDGTEYSFDPVVNTWGSGIGTIYNSNHAYAESVNNLTHVEKFKHAWYYKKD